MKFLPLIVAVVFVPVVTNAASTLQFSAPFIGGIASNFANAAGDSSVSLTWGIVVDTDGGGFAGGGSAYDPYLTPSTSGFLSQGSAVSTDFYIVGTGPTSNGLNGLPEAGSATNGQNGALGNVTVNYTGGVSAGDAFAIFWFDGNGADGSKYGFHSYGGVLPADNLPAADMSAPFIGVDPLRSATNTFGAAPIPEPSRMILLGLGGLLVMFRRRR